MTGGTRIRGGCAGLAVALAAGAAGCSSGNQNTLAPHSGPEHQITHLWWVMFIVSCVGFGFVALLLSLGWVRRHHPTLPGGGGEHAASIGVIVFGVAVPVLLLSALFAWSDFFVIRSTAAPALSSTRMTIHVIGHQWWWEVLYPGTTAVTANEIHIPVNTRVNLVATTDDVIHSFWVPELNRKIDMIPGRRNRILLEANTVGTYRGQCSEYCGLQHAHMTVTVVAQTSARFRAWLANMARPARTPAGGAAASGARLFLRQACAQCHQIRGTGAHGLVGPDLTHLATRQTLGADTIANTSSLLRRWIVDPQHFKPGNKMPALPLTNRQAHELTVYLDALH
jgi:cytochrome c oxidase subunit II